MSWDLRRSLLLWEAVEEVSLKLAEFVGRACGALGLEPVASVLVSLERVYEDAEYGREICGYYDPAGRRIVVSAPCVAERDFEEGLSTTLAHELIHHCQFTGGGLCELSLNPDLAAKVGAALPYRLRPHEVEAYSKQGELAGRLRELEGFAEAARYVKRLYSPEVVPPRLGSTLEALTRAPALQESARFIADLVGGELLPAARRLVEKFSQVIEDESARACFEEKAASYLKRMQEDFASILGDRVRSTAEKFLNGTAVVRAVVMDPGGSRPRAYLVLKNHGVAVGYDVREGAPPSSQCS